MVSVRISRIEQDGLPDLSKSTQFGIALSNHAEDDVVADAERPNAFVFFLGVFWRKADAEAEESNIGQAQLSTKQQENGRHTRDVPAGTATRKCEETTIFVWSSHFARTIQLTEEVQEARPGLAIWYYTNGPIGVLADVGRPNQVAGLDGTEHCKENRTLGTTPHNILSVIEVNLWTTDRGNVHEWSAFFEC